VPVSELATLENTLNRTAAALGTQAWLAVTALRDTARSLRAPVVVWRRRPRGSTVSSNTGRACCVMSALGT